MKTLTTAKQIARTSSATLMQDMIGALALVVMLVVGLHLPVFL